MLVVAGYIFLVLAIGLLVLIKPLNEEDLKMIGEVRPGMVGYLKPFGRKSNLKIFSQRVNSTSWHPFVTSP